MPTHIPMEEKATALRRTTIEEGMPNRMIIKLVNGKEVFWYRSTCSFFMVEAVLLGDSFAI